MPFSDTNTFARDDTFFGVCQAIGEDLGFNPNYLRVAFALPLLWAPLATLGAYFGLGLLVMLLRLLVPNPRRAVALGPDVADLDGDAPQADNEIEADRLPVAA